MPLLISSSIFGVLAELSSLTNQTTNLRLKTESETRQLTQAESINGKLKELKLRLDKLEKKSSNAEKKISAYSKTIKELRKAIAYQEQEISILRENIKNKDATIQKQGMVIDSQKESLKKQNSTIVKQEEMLRKTVKEQAELLFQAGFTLEQLADDDDQELNVSGRRNKAKVKEYKRAIYIKAAHFYSQAASQNHARAAERENEVREKIAAL